MKRSKFLAMTSFALGLPLIGLGRVKKFFRPRNGSFKAGAGEGRLHGHLRLKGVNSNVLDVKVSGADTEGDLAFFEQTSLSQGRGTPFHVHDSQDEIFYVLQGSYKFKVGEKIYDLVQGESIFLPRQVPHAWTQKETTGKMLVILQPAGKLEDFFVTMAALDHEPSKEEVNAMFSANGMKVVGPPLKLDE